MTRLTTQQPLLLDFSFHNIRNITSPEDSAAGRKVYAGTAPAGSVLDLPNDENVRDYIPSAPGRKRRALTAVHRSMFDTLEHDASSFAVKNGGIVIVAKDVDVDESKRKAKLLAPSLINGAQTQGVLQDFYAAEGQDQERPSVSVKFEIIVSDDDELIGEISIARNSQNNVDPLSIAGKKGVLDDLAMSMEAANPAWNIRIKETDGGEGVIDTPKLLQVTMALIPPNLWMVERDRENPNKVFTYSMRAKCLKDFQKLFNEAHDRGAKNHETAKAVYDFIVEMAPRAWLIYKQWKTHQGFIGTFIQQGVTREGSKVTDVADGIVFPILAALSVFVAKTSAGWALVPPPLWDEKDGIFLPLKDVLKSESVKGNPWNLGKHRDSWTLLFNQTRNHKLMAEKFARASGAMAG
jgi:fructose-specific phosphotransferase system component IIB